MNGHIGVLLGVSLGLSICVEAQRTNSNTHVKTGQDCLG